MRCDWCRYMDNLGAERQYDQSPLGCQRGVPKPEQPHAQMRSRWLCPDDWARQQQSPHPQAPQRSNRIGRHCPLPRGISKPLGIALGDVVRPVPPLSRKTHHCRQQLQTAHLLGQDTRCGNLRLVLSRFSSGLFRAMFAMNERMNGKEIHRRVSA